MLPLVLNMWKQDPALGSSLVESGTKGVTSVIDHSCYATPFEINGGWALELYAAVLLCALIAVLCDRYLMSTLEGYVARYKIPEEVAGVTFLALGGSAPELAIHVLATVQGNEIGMGTVIGSAVFNLLVGSTVVCLLVPTTIRLQKASLMRDLTCYSCALGVVYLFRFESVIGIWESLIMVCLYGVFILFVFASAGCFERINAREEAQQSLKAAEARMQKEPLLKASEDQAGRAPNAGGEQVATQEGMRQRAPIGARRRQPEVEDQGTAAQPEANVQVIVAEDAGEGGEDGGGAEEFYWIGPKDWSELSTLEKSLGVFLLPSKPIEWTLQYVIPPEPAGFETWGEYEEARGKLKQSGHHPEGKEESGSVGGAGGPKQFQLYGWLSPPAQMHMGFLLCMAFISLTSAALMTLIKRLGCASSLDSVYLGMTVLAAGASVPDAIAMGIAAKQGHGRMAMAGLIGSNVFDILLGLGMPWFLSNLITGNPVALTNPHVAIGILYLGVTIVVLVATLLATRFKLTRVVGVVLMVFYIVYIVLESFNIEFLTLKSDEAQQEAKLMNDMASGHF